MSQREAFGWRTPELRPVIELRIDELILDGFARHSGHRIGAALERELSRLLSTGDLTQLMASPVQFDSLNAGKLRLHPNASPDHVGRQLARRVYGQLTRGQQPGGPPNTAEGVNASHA